MLNRIIFFIKKPTSKNIIINTIGNYLNVFFTLFFFLLYARIFSRSQIGALSVLLGIAYVLANILDFGTTATIYSYLPSLIENKSKNLFSFIKTTFFYQFIFSFIVIIILFITFPNLDKAFFKTGAPIEELYLTATMVLFLVWQNFALNILYAAKKIVQANVYLNTSNVIKTLFILFLILIKKITVGTILFTFGILGPIIFFIFLFFEKKVFALLFIRSKINPKEFRFNYMFVNFIASQFLNLGLRMDLFLLSYFRWFVPQSQVGIYGIAQKIILSIMTTIISITQVISPNFSRIKLKKDLLKEFKTGFLYLCIPSALFFLLIITPNIVFQLFFDEKWITAPIARMLALPFILFTFSNLPILFLLYTVKKPLPILFANIVFFLILSLGCYWIIPKRGIYGPPLIIMIGFLVNIAILLFYTMREYKKIPAV